MKSYQKCRKCGAVAVNFFPVEINSDKKPGGMFFLSLCIICGIISSITAIVTISIFLKNFETIISSELATFTMEKFSDAISILASWKISSNIFKISSIAFLIFLAVYKLLPYKRIVHVYSICQNCGYKLEILGESFAYHIDSKTIVKKDDD